MAKSDIESSVFVYWRCEVNNDDSSVSILQQRRSIYYSWILQSNHFSVIWIRSTKTITKRHNGKYLVKLGDRDWKNICFTIYSIFYKIYLKLEISEVDDVNKTIDTTRESSVRMSIIFIPSLSPMGLLVSRMCKRIVWNLPSLLFNRS